MSALYDKQDRMVRCKTECSTGHRASGANGYERNLSNPRQVARKIRDQQKSPGDYVVARIGSGDST